MNFNSIRTIGDAIKASAKFATEHPLEAQEKAQREGEILELVFIMASVANTPKQIAESLIPVLCQDYHLTRLGLKRALLRGDIELWKVVESKIAQHDN